MALSKITSASITDGTIANTDVADSTLTTTKLATPNLGRRNVLINGNFDVWQRGTSLSAAGFITDRWRSTTGLNGAMTISRQSFATGQTDVPNNPKYFFRHAQTTAHTNTGYNHDRQRIEGVETLAGKVCTLTWYMKADASRTIAVRRIQNFGTGGSPSASVDTQILASQTITTSWVKYTLTFTMPSINGKTIGTNNNDYVEIGFDYGAEANNTYTIDIAQVQLEANSQATPFEHRTFAEELSACQRYYVRAGGANYASIFGLGGIANTTGSWYGLGYVPVPMRTGFTLIQSGGSPRIQNGQAGFTASSISMSLQATNMTGLSAGCNASGLTLYRWHNMDASSNATLFELDAEL